MKTCEKCGATGDRVFCPQCGGIIDRPALESVRLMGPIGTQHSNSPKIEEFWATGNPDVFVTP